jgi:hypothetical protein
MDSRIIKNKYIIIGIIANIIFLGLSFWEYGELRITIFHILFGIVPLMITIIRRFSKSIDF